MRRITVLIDKPSKMVNFQETILKDPDAHILVKHVVLFWDNKNADSSSNEVLYTGSQKELITQKLKMVTP